MLDITTVKQYDYKGNPEKIPAFAKAKELLSGKSLEEQVKLLCLERSEDFEEFSYGQSDYQRSHGSARPLAEADNVRGILLYKNMIVGVVINGRDVLLGKCVETYYAVDEDGTGREEVSVYHTLLFAE